MFSLFDLKEKTGNHEGQVRSVKYRKGNKFDQMLISVEQEVSLWEVYSKMSMRNRYVAGNI